MKKKIKSAIITMLTRSLIRPVDFWFIALRGAVQPINYPTGSDLGST